MNLNGIDLSKVKFVEVVEDEDLEDFDDEMIDQDGEENEDDQVDYESDQVIKVESLYNDKKDKKNNSNEKREKKTLEINKSRAQTTTQNRKLKTVFKPESVIGSIYTGGPIIVNSEASFMITTCSNRVCFVSTEDGVELYEPLVFEAKVTALSLSPDNTKLMVALNNLHLHIYDMTKLAGVAADEIKLVDADNDQQADKTDQKEKEDDITRTSRLLIRMWKAHEAPILSIDFHSSGGVVATGSADGSVRVWDIDKGFCTHNLKDDCGVVSIVKFHSKTLRVVAVSDDNNIRVWDLVTKQRVILENHLAQISGITFSNSKEELISCGRDKVLSLWDMTTLKLKKTVPIFQELSGIITLPKRFLNSTSLPEKLQAKIKAIRTKLSANPQLSSKVSKEDLTIVVGGYDVMRAWCMETGESVWREDGLEKKDQKDNDQDIEPLFTYTHILIILFELLLILIITSRQSKDKIISVTSEHNMIVYECESFDRVSEIIGYNDEIVDIKYLNKTEIAVATNSNEIRLYDLNTKKSKLLRGHSDLVMAIDVSNDGKLLVSASRDNSIRLWNVETLECLSVGNGHTGVVSAIAMSKKSGYIISGSLDRTLKLWKLNGKTKQLEVQTTVIAHDKDINSIQIAPNDKLVATGSQDTYVKLWNAADLKSAGVIKAHRRGVWSVDFSPVDQCLLSTSADGSIKIWSLADFSCLKTFEGHSGSVLRATFISYGMQIVSVGTDSLVKLWTIKTNECVNTFEKHDAKIWALAVTPQNDQQQFITGSSDSRIIVWKDYTILEEIEKHLKEEEAIKNQQSLDTSLRQRDFKRALKLALILNQPRQSLNIFNMMMESENGEDLIKSTLKKFGKLDIVKILKFVRDWNTNSKFVPVSQIILRSIMTMYLPSEIIKIHELPELLESLIPYNERHFQRLDRILQKTYLLDFTISSINPAASDLLKQR
ncbi:WD40 repeat-containing protein [Heterostelium album PN500]|uniref:WD40 repeat-containing protein n=1 Tax=Heterostelium pallidum (strain ATCC 26659 / Pp 5 / PN500) TaxID=670386 RepID=D3BGA4_HETP5|nr:WD40 repeat-containing protein [Heterostelium album PN500]EFA79504.1 WD40 repeat-containing protein [Heterostelium album PN500]|eukprot:XP_020431625.1 WD40 repeat-containing protein [Heterostelium album PN500]